MNINVRPQEAARIRRTAMRREYYRSRNIFEGTTGLRQKDHGTVRKRVFYSACRGYAGFSLASAAAKIRRLSALLVSQI